MPRYRLHLHDGPTTPPVSRDIEADSDDDANDLARVTLLMTQVYTHAEVYRGDDKVGAHKRDSYDGDVA